MVVNNVANPLHISDVHSSLDKILQVCIARFTPLTLQNPESRANPWQAFVHSSAKLIFKSHWKWKWLARPDGKPNPTFHFDHQTSKLGSECSHPSIRLHGDVGAEKYREPLNLHIPQLHIARGDAAAHFPSVSSSSEEGS